MCEEVVFLTKLRVNMPVVKALLGANIYGRSIGAISICIDSG